MSKDQPYLLRPGVDEQMIVDEMIHDLSHEYWGECYVFVTKCVNAKAQNLLNHLLDDIVQEIMLKVTKYLPHFRFQCSLKTWLNAIIDNHIIDEYRKQRNQRPHLLLSIDQPDEGDAESVEAGMKGGASTEETFEQHEKIRLGVEALQEYANAHSDPVRNRHIIRMVVFEGKTYEEAAIATGCNAPVAGNVVREAQRYAREKRNNEL